MSKKIQKQDKPLQSNERKVKEVFVHKFQGRVQSVDVTVFIDYVNGTISIVDGVSPLDMTMKAKHYNFTGRQIGYMAGWKDILDGIRSAVVVAEDRLRTYQKERELEREIRKAEIAKAIAGEKDSFLKRINVGQLI